MRNNISAILLAGGRGTRLASVISDRPKVLAPVAGRPFLAYLLDQLVDAEVAEVVLSTGYLAAVIGDTFGDSYRGLPLRYVKESQPLGTGGAIALAARHTRGDELLVMNGDSYVDMDLKEVIEFHRHWANDATLVLVRVANASRFGSVVCNEDQRIVAFHEKRGEPTAGDINGGIYLMSRFLADELPQAASSLEHDVLPAWVADDYVVRGFRTDARFIDIGIPQSYAESHAFMEERVHA